MDRSTIDRYEQGAPKLRQAIAGLSRAQLTAFPVPGTWSIAQIVVHLWDSDLAATHRMKRIASEDTPLLIAYDESAFAQRLNYQTAYLDRACSLFELNRAHTAEFLRALPDEAFARTGVHNQRGLVSLAQMVGMYVEHLDHHLRFIASKRVLVCG